MSSQILNIANYRTKPKLLDQLEKLYKKIGILQISIKNSA